MLALYLFIAFFLLMIFAEDLRSRSVHWFWFPLLALALVALKLVVKEPWADIMRDTMVNAGFLLLQLGLLTAYFSLKQQRWVNITAGLLGWGDVLFVGCLTCYFSPLNFIVFYVASLILIVLGWLVYQSIIQNKREHIPLAGLQALLLVLTLAISRLKPTYPLTQDEYLLNLLSRWTL